MLCNVIPVDFRARPLFDFFWCYEIYRDSQFLNMALKAEWVTQHDLCNHGKSVGLHCLPGAIVTTNPRLIKPNSAFCLTVKAVFFLFSVTDKKQYLPPVKHQCFVKTQGCCPTRFCCATCQDMPETLKWFPPLCILFYSPPYLFSHQWDGSLMKSMLSV